MNYFNKSAEISRKIIPLWRKIKKTQVSVALIALWSWGSMPLTSIQRLSMKCLFILTLQPLIKIFPLQTLQRIIFLSSGKCKSCLSRSTLIPKVRSQQGRIELTTVTRKRHPCQYGMVDVCCLGFWVGSCSILWHIYFPSLHCHILLAVICLLQCPGMQH